MSTELGTITTMAQKLHKNLPSAKIGYACKHASRPLINDRIDEALLAKIAYEGALAAADTYVMVQFAPTRHYTASQQASALDTLLYQLVPNHRIHGMVDKERGITIINTADILHDANFTVDSFFKRIANDEPLNLLVGKTPCPRLKDAITALCVQPEARVALA